MNFLDINQCIFIWRLEQGRFYPVKEYSRPAAGMRSPAPSDIRYSFIYWFICSLVNWLIDSLILWFSGIFIVSLVHWCWFIGSLIIWFVCFLGLLIHSLIHSSFLSSFHSSFLSSFHSYIHLFIHSFIRSLTNDNFVQNSRLPGENCKLPVQYSVH